MELVAKLLYFVWQVDNIDDLDAFEVVAGTVNVYSDDDIEDTLVSDEDNAVKLIRSWNE